MVTTVPLVCLDRRINEHWFCGVIELDSDPRGDARNFILLGQPAAFPYKTVCGIKCLDVTHATTKQIVALRTRRYWPDG